eukprot:scaffold127559_cov23-Cyclotella_meneghiniana.AAC.1
MISPSTLATTTTNLSVHEEKFCERLKQIAHSLKRTAEEFGLGDNGNSAQPQYHVPSSIGDHQLLSSPALQDMVENRAETKPTQQYQPSSPILLRKPLEPVGMVVDKRQSMEPEIFRANVDKDTFSGARELVSLRRSDPPGSSPPDEGTSRRADATTTPTNRSQTSRKLYAQEGQSITPIRSMADPPECNSSSSNPWHNITTPLRKNGTRTDSPRNWIRTSSSATSQRKNVAQVYSPRRKVESQINGAHRERISPGSSTRVHTSM